MISNVQETCEFIPWSAMCEKPVYIFCMDQFNTILKKYKYLLNFFFFVIIKSANCLKANEKLLQYVFY